MSSSIRPSPLVQWLKLLDSINELEIELIELDYRQSLSIHFMIYGMELEQPASIVFTPKVQILKKLPRTARIVRIPNSKIVCR